MLAVVEANVSMWGGMGHCHLDWLEISRGCKNKRMALDWLIHCKPEALGAAGMPRAVHAVFCSSFHLSSKGGWCFAILIEGSDEFSKRDSSVSILQRWTWAELLPKGSLINDEFSSWTVIDADVTAFSWADALGITICFPLEFLLMLKKSPILMPML